MDSTTMSRTPSREKGFLPKQKVSERTVRDFQQHELSARQSWIRLSLTVGHSQEHKQWCVQKRTWKQECITFWRISILFTASWESHPCLRHRGKRTLSACIRHRHTGPSTGMMIWGAIEYMSPSSLARIESTLNSSHYISVAIRPVILSFIRSLR